MRALLVVLLVLALLPAAGFGQAIPDTAYLFSYFTGNGEDGLHLAWSADGYTFTALNGGASYLTPVVGEDHLMRDPCLLLGPDGVFRMVWTTSWSGKTVGFASSTNLVDWSDQLAIPVWAGHPDEADVENTWAPEVHYDAANDRYLIVWATTITGAFPETDFDGQNDNNHRQYATTTSNFVDFTQSRLFFEPGFNVIDATFIEVSNLFYMVFKDETRYPTAHKYLQIATSTDINGPYGNISAPFTPPGRWSEGPTAVQVGDDYMVYYDAYTEGRYSAARSPNMVDWTDVTDLISFPSGARHGTVLQVPGSVISNLVGVAEPETNLNYVVHRWSFNDAAGAAPAGTVTPDESGTAAVVRGAGATFTGTALDLPGDTTGNTAADSIAAYLDLPNGILSSLTNLTIEVWATPQSSRTWQRVCDFGRTVQTGDGLGADGEWTGAPGTGAPGSTQASDNFFLSFNRSGGLDEQRLGVRLDGGAETLVDTSLATTPGTAYHYVMTFADGAGAHGGGGGQWRWYRDGWLIGSVDADFRLADIEDVNNWLGRSQWSGDSNTDAAYDELRIHSIALSPAEVLGNYQAGPDAPTGEPPPRPVPVLVHRYSFGGFGTVVVDSVGDVDGTLMNASLDGSGKAVFNNDNVLSGDLGALQWVDFGRSLVPTGASNLTVEAWFTPAAYAAVSGDQGQWLFNLTDAVGGGASSGRYLFYTPWSAGTPAFAEGVKWSKGGWNNETMVFDSSGLNTPVPHHCAVVVDGIARALKLYSDGALVGTSSFDGTFDLADLATAWLARASYGADAGYEGEITELRVYDGALSAPEITSSLAAGPDTVALPGPALRIELQNGHPVVAWPAGAASYPLKAAVELTSVGAWTTVTNEVVLTNGEAQVVVDPHAPAEYFRLEAP